MSNLPSDPQEAPSKREDSGHPQQLSEQPPTERRSILTLSSESHSGMLPHPAILEAYEKIRKGITDDFVDMAKSILAHDHDVEKSSNRGAKTGHGRHHPKHEIGYRERVTLAAFALVYFLISNGHTIAGLVPLLVPLSVLANRFLAKDRQPQSHTTDEHDDRLNPPDDDNASPPPS